MTGVAYALSSSVFSSLFFVFSARVLRGKDEASKPSALSVLSVTHIAAGLILLPFSVSSLSNLASSNALGYLASLCLLLSVLQLTARFFHFKALSIADVSVVSPFAGLMPIATLLVAWSLLGEIPTYLSVLGILIVSLCLVLISTDRNGLDSSLSQKRLRIARWLAIFAAIPPAFRTVVQKNAIEITDPMTLSCVMLLFTGVLALPLSKFSKKEARTIEPGLCLKLCLISSLLAINIYFFTCALLYDLAANVSAIARITIIFQIVFAYFLIGQRHQIKHRLLWGLGVFFGTVLVTLGSLK